MSEDRPHKFADRTLREILEDPRSVEDLARVACPEVIGKLDFTQVEYLKRTGSKPDMSEREADVLCLVRCKDVQGDVLCCVLIEHQSTVEPDMALRILEYATQTWHQAWKKQTSRQKRLHGILPIVPTLADRLLLRRRV